MCVCVSEGAREAGVGYAWAAVFASLLMLLISAKCETVSCKCTVLTFALPSGGLHHQHAERSSGGSGV